MKLGRKLREAAYESDFYWQSGQPSWWNEKLERDDLTPLPIYDCLDIEVLVDDDVRGT
jgi:hypothetical protein